MSSVETLKKWLGYDDHDYEYRCQECGRTFESNVEPDSVWLSCRRCDSEDLENITQQ